MTAPRLMQSAFTGGEFAPALHARVDLAKYGTGLKTARNVFVHAQGGVSNRAGFQMVGAVGFNELTIQIPFVVDYETGETYDLIFSEGRIRFTREASPILGPTLGQPVVTITQDPGADTYEIVAGGISEGDEFIWTQPSVSRLHARTVHARNVAGDEFQLQFLDNGEFLGNTPDFATHPAELYPRYTVEVPYTENELRDVTFTQDNDVMYMAHTNHPPKKLSRLADDNWTFADVIFAPTITAPLNLTVVARHSALYNSNEYSEKYTYVVASVAADSGEESYPSNEVFVNGDMALSRASNLITWDVVDGASRYVIYKNVNGSYGYIGTTDGLEFIDKNIAENGLDAPQTEFDPFNEPGEYPRAVALHEQRLCFASTTNDPQAVFLSQSTVLENFGVASPSKDTDAITFRVRTKQRQRINNLLSTTAGLAMFTSSGEWLVTGGSDDFLTPSNPVPRQQTSRGSYYLPPINVGDVVMYAQARGAVVRDFSYSFESDGFKGPDRTIFSRHLFDGKRIVSWAYCQSPYSIIWAALDDGTLLAFTYIEEHDVWGWTPQELDGEVVSVLTLPEGDEDVLYAIIKRDRVGGGEAGEVYTQERMTSRLVDGWEDWFFVDAGYRYVGEATDTLDNLGYLEGVDVAVLADGNVVEEVTVTDGTITLPYSATNIVVGRPYTAEVETLDLDMGNLPDFGTVQGRMVSISEIFLHVEKTRGVFTGSDRENMNEHKQRANEDYGAAIGTYTGKIQIDPDPDYTDAGNVIVQQRAPLPMTLLAVMPDVTVGS